MKIFDTILLQLKSQGVRITRTRNQLLEIITSTTSPYSAEDLVKLLKVNKTTVYRELQFFMAQGLVAEIDFGEGKKRYEFNHGHHHHHVVCTSCSKVEHIDVPDDLKAIEKQISRSKKFRITSHNLEFFGLCGNCQK